jgi:hypothetical protein
VAQLKGLSHNSLYEATHLELTGFALGAKEFPPIGGLTNYVLLNRQRTIAFSFSFLRFHIYSLP